MAWRKAHGNAAERGRLVVTEAPPVDELPPAAGSPPAKPERDELGRLLPGNSLGRNARARAGLRGALRLLEAKADPNWRAARRWGRSSAVHRIREYGQAHGPDLSSGVCAMLAEACELRADACYLRARAAADDNPDLLRTAAQLSAGARQAERDAWELATREAAARKASQQHGSLLSQLVAGSAANPTPVPPLAPPGGLLPGAPLSPPSPPPVPPKELITVSATEEPEPSAMCFACDAPATHRWPAPGREVTADRQDAYLDVVGSPLCKACDNESCGAGAQTVASRIRARRLDKALAERTIG